MFSDKQEIPSIIISYLSKVGIFSSVNDWQYILTASVLLIIIAVLAHLVARIILSLKVTRLVHLTKTDWDDQLLKHGVFRRIAHFAPAAVIYILKPVLFIENSGTYDFISDALGLYVIFTLYMVLSACLNAGESIYSRSSASLIKS